MNQSSSKVIKNTKRYSSQCNYSTICIRVCTTNFFRYEKHITQNATLNRIEICRSFHYQRRSERTMPNQKSSRCSSSGDSISIAITYIYFYNLLSFLFYPSCLSFISFILHNAVESKLAGLKVLLLVVSVSVSTSLLSPICSRKHRAENPSINTFA